jgi:hypothetical protein
VGRKEKGIWAGNDSAETSAIVAMPDSHSGIPEVSATGQIVPSHPRFLRLLERCLSLRSADAIEIRSTQHRGNILIQLSCHLSFQIPVTGWRRNLRGVVTKNSPAHGQSAISGYVYSDLPDVVSVQGRQEVTFVPVYKAKRRLPQPQYPKFRMSVRVFWVTRFSMFCDAAISVPSQSLV